MIQILNRESNPKTAALILEIFIQDKTSYMIKSEALSLTLTHNILLLYERKVSALKSLQLV